MKYLPHDYQKYAIQYIEEHPTAAVFLSMGLGKTSITLTAIRNLMFDRFEVRRVLVIGPIRVVSVSWPEELGRWDHLSILTFSVAVGTPAERRRALSARSDITLINRENVSWLVDELGSSFDFDMIVIDELSSFKNWQSKRFKSLMRVRPLASRVVGLTGTPASGGLMDLFAELKCLDMGKRLGRFIGEYRRNYFVPDKVNGPIVYSYRLLPGAEEAIYEKISDITISMKSADHLKMPELVSRRYMVYLSESERRQYEEMKRTLVLQLPDGEVTASNAAVLSGKLCQLANGAIYDDKKTPILLHERKLDALEDIAEAVNGNPLLVAYWFAHDADRIEKRLDRLHIRHERLRTPESIRRWNERKIPVALIHPASAGHGLNLQAGGSLMVWFSPIWSLELYQQTLARLWRQGQESRTVVVQHILTEGTIDLQIMEALENKDKTQASLIDAVKANL